MSNGNLKPASIQPLTADSTSELIYVCQILPALTSLLTVSEKWRSEICIDLLSIGYKIFGDNEIVTKANFEEEG